MSPWRDTHPSLPLSSIPNSSATSAATISVSTGDHPTQHAPSGMPCGEHHLFVCTMQLGVSLVVNDQVISGTDPFDRSIAHRFVLHSN